MSESVRLIWEGVLDVALLLRATLRGDYGQTLAEYSLVLTLVAVGVVVPTTILFRNAMAGAFDSATNCMNLVTC